MAPFRNAEDEVEAGFLSNIADANRSSNEESSSEEQSAEPPRVGRVVAASVAGLMLFALLAIATFANQRMIPDTLARAPASLRPEQKDDLMAKLAGNAPAAAPAAADAASTAASTASTFSGVAQGVTNTLHKATVKPQENMQDGNKCDDNEEMHAELCYKKCSLLTQGAYTHRVSAFSCCKTGECHNIFKLNTASLIPCHGYDVSGADQSTACPHLPGTCLEDEEQFMGMCFKKCSIITDGKYPNRVGAASCCKNTGVACLDPFNDMTKGAMAVGGGSGDHDGSTPAGAHLPMTSLTEK